MAFYQYFIRLRPRTRGFHLITAEVEAAIPELSRLKVGVCQVFIQHTSASLTINENADPTVRHDLEAHFNLLAPENAAHYRHNDEGPDDMPAHIKAVLLGSSVSIPITKGSFALGIWQGIYLCEHRDHAGARNLVITVYGEE